MVTCPETGLKYHTTRAAMAFRHALAAENKGDHEKAQRLLDLAVKYDVPEEK